MVGGAASGQGTSHDYYGSHWYLSPITVRHRLQGLCHQQSVGARRALAQPGYRQVWAEGLSVPGKPQGSDGILNAQMQLAKQPHVPPMPSHSTLAFLGLGKTPAPLRFRAKGVWALATGLRASTNSSICSDGTLPRNLRVRCTLSGRTARRFLSSLFRIRVMTPDTAERALPDSSTATKRRCDCDVGAPRVPGSGVEGLTGCKVLLQWDKGGPEISTECYLLRAFPLRLWTSDGGTESLCLTPLL